MPWVGAWLCKAPYRQSTLVPPNYVPVSRPPRTLQLCETAGIGSFLCDPACSCVGQPSPAPRHLWMVTARHQRSLHGSCWCVPKGPKDAESLTIFYVYRHSKNASPTLQYFPVSVASPSCERCRERGVKPPPYRSVRPLSIATLATPPSKVFSLTLCRSFTIQSAPASRT